MLSLVCTGPITRLAGATGSRLGPVVERAQLRTPERREKVRSRLDAAGRPHGLTVETYCERKGAAIGLSAVVALMLVVAGVWLAGLLILAFGLIYVDMDIDGRARRRQTQIDRDLPDFLDVLAVCVSAGIAFRPAMARVSDSLGGPVSEEVNTTLRQMALGSPRRVAFEALRGRNPSDFVSTFVTAVLQAEELGVPLADALAQLARDIRQEAYQHARRRAQRAAPRVSLVVTLVILPAAVLLLFGAIILGNVDTIRGLSGR